MIVPYGYRRVELGEHVLTGDLCICYALFNNNERNTLDYYIPTSFHTSECYKLNNTNLIYIRRMTNTKLGNILI